MRIAILGGGISGCSIAAELAADGRVDVTLIERAPRLGGLHRSIEVGGYTFDIGAFVFDHDHSIFSVFPELLEIFLLVPNRYGAARAGGALDEYPLTIGGTRREFGSAFLGRVLAEVLISKIRRSRRDSVPGFVEYYIGPTLYRRSGLQTYIERLYLAPHDEIDVEFARKRLDVIGESAGLRRNLLRVASALARGRGITDLVKPLTADSLYVRPESGFEEVYDRIGKRLVTDGVTVLRERSVSRIEPNNGRFRLHGLGGDDCFDQVFSTIPLELSARLLGLTDFVTPEYMDLYSLFYELEGEPRFPYNVLHNFTNKGQWKRLIVFSHYYGTRNGRHFLTVEGTARPGGERIDVLRAGAEDFEGWMQVEALLPGGLRFVDGIVTPRSYPVYRTATARGVLQLKQSVEAQGIRLAGRQGAFDYITSSDAAGNARAAAATFLDEIST